MDTWVHLVRVKEIKSCKFIKSFEIKIRKPTQAHQENFEIITLINAKKVEHEISLEVVESWHKMETLVTKWKHISKVVMANRHKRFKP